MPEAAKKAGLQAWGRKLSNHSVRKTIISRLLDAGIPENFVTQLSGHKILQSLGSYKSASLAHQRQMSDTLQSKFLLQIQALTSRFFLSTKAAVRSSVQFPTRAFSAFKRCRTIHSSRRQPSDQFQTACLILFIRENQPAVAKKT